MSILDSILKPITGLTGSGLLKSLGQSENMRDYQHASKLFVSNGYELSPKTQFLYHVYFNINSSARSLVQNWDSLKKLEVGMLVKSVDLPKYKLNTKVLNAYNRKQIVQSKLDYEPVQLVMHDDSQNVARDLWQAYLKYYYRDTDYGVDKYKVINTYDPRITDQWGYTIRGDTGAAQNFFTSIKIYSLSLKKYSLYELINPKIDGFEHGRHDVSQGTGTMEHTMRVSYETVKYSQGYVGSGNVSGFAQQHYDTQPSPLSPLGGGTKSILGPGGLIDSAANIADNLGEGNFGAAALGALRASQNLKNFDFKAVAKQESIDSIRNVIRNTANGPFKFPSPNSEKPNQATP
jgi:hypothetical protein